MFKQLVFLISILVSLSCGKKHEEERSLNKDSSQTKEEKPKSDPEVNILKPCENEFRVEPKQGIDLLKIGEVIQVCFNNELVDRMSVNYDENVRLLESPSPYEIRLKVVKSALTKIKVKFSRKDGQGFLSYLATYGGEPENEAI